MTRPAVYLLAYLLTAVTGPLRQACRGVGAARRQRVVGLALVATQDYRTDVTAHAVRAYITKAFRYQLYARVENRESGSLNGYLMRDILQRTSPKGATQLCRNSYKERKKRNGGWSNIVRWKC